VHLLGELDQEVLAQTAVGGVVEQHDPQLGEALAALAEHQVGGEGVDVLEPHGGVVRQHR
jgi:hypothetical protein